MGYVISLINVKGGVGKTTVTFNLAHALKLKGKRVLLVDLDLQENLSDRAIANKDEVNNTVYDLLSRDEVEIEDCIYDTVIEGVKILPAEMELARINREIDTLSDSNTIMSLKNKLNIVKDKFEYILIDLHPDLDVLSTMALLSSNYYIIPVKPDADSIKGLKITDTFVDKISNINSDLKELGVVITDYDKRTKIAKTFEESLRNMLDERLMDTVIARNVAITDASVNRMSIFQYDKRQSGCFSFKKLGDEVIEKCEQTY